MEGKEKGVERESKKQGFMVKKLKRGFLIGKRGGPCTPPPTWRLEFSPQQNDNSSNNKNPIREFLNFPTTTVSARKLCANLWEIQPHQHTPLAEMSKIGIRLRRRQNHHQHTEPGLELPKEVVELPHSPTDQPASASSLRRHVAASLKQHYRSAERSGYALQPVSPASYSSSMEMAPYNPAEAPNSSLHHKGRMGESSYNLQTSAELLKVLNRIWSLEEQHASNISLVKALKMELGYYQARVKELLREKQSDRQEMDNLIKKKYTEDKLLRKIQEQDRIIAAVQSVKQELEDERKLRKRSESLHRKLARELSAIKSSFSDALRELERERKARILLESLCDEFARGIRDYEQVLRSLRQKPEKGQVGGESLDRLILHISEAWLDERMQMKLSEPGKDLAERNTIVDKLRFDIETFLQAKQSVDLKKYSNLSPKELKEVYSHRNSSESSFPLKEAISAPQNVAGEEDSTDSDSNFEPKKTTGNKNSKGSFRKQGNNAAEGHREGNKNSNSMRRKVGQEKTTQVGDQSVERKPSNIGGEQPAAVNDNEISKICDTTEIVEDRPIKRSGSYQSNSNHVPDNLIRNHSLSSEGVQIHPESNCKENSSIQSVVTGNASPAQQWMSKLKFPDTEKSETSLKWPTGIKENTLMAKLLEARFERQQTRSKACKGSL